MEGKADDEVVVDIESASSGSFNDDSDDEGSLPSEIDDKVIEVSHVDLFLISLSLSL